MNQQKSFPYLQALNCAVTQLIDHFSTFFYFALSWIGIWIVLNFLAIISFILFLGANRAGMIPWELLDKIPAGETLFWGSYYAGISFFYLLIHAQLVHIAFTIYAVHPVSLKKVFFSTIKTQFLFVIARYVYALKFVSCLVLLNIPGLPYLGTTYYFSGYSLAGMTTSSLNEDAHHSQEVTKGHFWQILFVLLAHALLVVGILWQRPTGPFTVPTSLERAFIPLSINGALLLFVLPILVLTEVHLFKTLRTRTKEQSSSTPE